MTEIIGAVDPGSSLAGVALFHDGHLTAADLARSKRAPLAAYYGPDVRRYADVALTVVAWFSSRVARLDTLSLEWPQVYGGGGRKEDPNDLLPLAAVQGGIVACLDLLAFPVGQVRVYLPRSWKGTVRKEIFTDRIRARLDVAETAIDAAVRPESLRHNATDAVGLGLYELGRLGTRPARALRSGKG